MSFIYGCGRTMCVPRDSVWIDWPRYLTLKVLAVHTATVEVVDEHGNVFHYSYDEFVLLHRTQ